MPYLLADDSKTPLAELVKLDPKVIGVGQYQHDVDQTALKHSLDDMVMQTVNQVGVELNSASAHLLTYVSGLGPKLAQAIVEYRQANGPISSRAQLKKVPRLGPKVFEQCAGFLRIHNSSQPLDASAVHPERYKTVQQMASDLSTTVSKLISNPDVHQHIDINRYVTDELGKPTLKDIINELAKPGRDPRGQFEQFFFADVHTINDLEEDDHPRSRQ